MANKFIVECPHCKMRFFVTDDLLDAANGNLRCGFCLHIFNGKERIVYEAMGNKVAAHSSTETQKATSSSIIANESNLQQPANDYSEEYWREVVQTFSSFSIDSDKADEQQAKPKENKIAPNEQLSLADSEGLSEELFDLSIRVDRDITAYIDEIDFSSSLQQDEQQIIDNHNNKVKKFIEDSIDTSTSTQAELALSSSQETDQLSQATTRDDIPVLDDENVVKDIYGNKLKVLSSIDFQYPAVKPKLVNKTNVFWAMLSLLALAGLVGQYLHYAIPKMTFTANDRVWANKVCQYVFCQLPTPIDVNMIKTDKLVVRSDPDQLGALLVDSIIYNTADFPQPYPVIELRFTNLNGQLIASRRFLPEQYLNNEALGKNQMPVGMPVYISFQIVDPGEEATGYSLHYYPAPTLSNQHH